MAEWSNAPVLKTGVLQGTGGSLPSLSAVESCKSKDLQDFFIIAPFGRWQKTKFLFRRYFTKKTRCTS